MYRSGGIHRFKRWSQFDWLRRNVGRFPASVTFTSQKDMRSLGEIVKGGKWVTGWTE
jgi:hypothetical protein